MFLLVVPLVFAIDWDDDLIFRQSYTFNNPNYNNHSLFDASGWTSDGGIGYWKLDNGTGNITDYENKILDDTEDAFACIRNGGASDFCAQDDIGNVHDEDWDTNASSSCSDCPVHLYENTTLPTLFYGDINWTAKFSRSTAGDPPLTRK